MLLDFRAPFNWLRAALRPPPAVSSSAPRDLACPLLHPHAPLPASLATARGVGASRPTDNTAGSPLARTWRD